MTDSTEKDIKKESTSTLKIASPGKLSLTKTVESGKVQQKFTHGRSKNVTVEVRKTRTFAAGTSGNMVEVKHSAGGKSAGDGAIRTLTEEERQSRLRALQGAADAPKTSHRLAHQELEELEEVEQAPRERPIAKDGVVMSPALIKKQQQTETSAEPAAVKATQEHVKKPVVKPKTLDMDAEGGADAKGKLKLKREKGAEKIATGKLSLNTAFSEDGGRVRSLASMRRQREKVMKKALGVSGQETEKFVREIVIPEAITVQELANRMAVRAVDVIKTLMKLGMMVTVTQSIDADTAELVVGEFGHKFKRVAESDVENVLKDEIQDDPALLKPRPPVVTIMGHVDHGKTSLLDALRQTDVAAKEAGGITQHIGAYQIDLGGGKVTFLDTPGHEAFTAMRARGAKVTDIVVLVVAADDGIMAQTKEAINHAKAAEVPIIVAINKIDKPDADANRVKSELMNHELVPEEFGGNVICVEVSAKQKLNLDKLVENILIQSEVLELKANPDRAASGAVIEAKLDQGRGVVATILVQKGTLKVGDIVVAGAAYGRVRTLMNDKGQVIKEAVPGMPVEVQGLNLAPEAGDVFSAVDSEKTARDIAEYREKLLRETQTRALGTRSIDQMFAANKGMKELAVVIKGDVQGSVEAIAGSVSKFNNEEVAVKILHTGVGAVSESDITLAKATGALIVAFNVRANAKTREIIQRDKLDIRYYSVIYDVVNDIKAALGGMLSPTAKENFLGYAEIRQVFDMSKFGKVAGCYVTEGMIKRGAKVRLLRDNVVIHEGTLKTLKRFKDEVKEVKSGFECGMAFENYEDIREGDQIEAFEIENVARTID
jgi:translation initiation factor IF-2